MERPPLTPKETEILQTVATYGPGISFSGDTAARRKAAIGLIGADLLSGSYTNCRITDAGRAALACIKSQD